MGYSKWSRSHNSHMAVISVWVVASIIGFSGFIYHLFVGDYKGEDGTFSHSTNSTTYISQPGYFVPGTRILECSKFLLYLFFLVLIIHLHVRVFFAAKQNSSTIRRNSTFMPSP